MLQLCSSINLGPGKKNCEQKFEVTEQKYNIWEYFHDCSFWFTLGTSHIMLFMVSKQVKCDLSSKYELKQEQK